MDVDDLAGHGFAQLGGEHLHVPRQDYQLDVVLADQIKDLLFLVGLGVLVDGQVVELDVVALGQGLEVWVIGDDDGDVDGQLACLVPEQQIVEAMADLGDHYQNLGFCCHRSQVVVHLDLFGQRGEGRL